ncbi:MAG: glycoside hydrolase 15-like protein [Candidatus Saccharibacteria bacterium]|nr:glycoside hydrolase 15-like protein [Candidatus Saccharibacteria bacterium]
MGRPVVLSNGQMFIGLNEHGLVHDFYYPYVGLENLTTSRSLHHKIGIYVDKTFSWTDDDTWEISVLFEADALISSVRLHSKDLGVTLHLQDTIDYEMNIFIRKVRVENLAKKDREIRLFMHQVFQISSGGRSDTALYVPDSNYILDYKGRFCLAIGGQQEDGKPFDQYAIGNYGIEGKAGTYMDAEDGDLSNNPVEHGGVDSVLRFPLRIDAASSATVHYWIAAGSSQNDVEEAHGQLQKSGEVDKRFHQTRLYWQEWLHPNDERFTRIPERERLAVQQSLLLIKAHCDSRGSILASGDSSIFNYGRDYYCYCWPRDAAYALWPLLRTGHFDEAKQFFLFARDVLHRDGYMMHKYQPDRAIGSTWHPLVHNRHKELAIQEDETAIMLFMLNELYEASNDSLYVQNLYNTFVVPCANFLAAYVDDETGLPHASYDLWEQSFATFTYTVCTVIAGLEAAARLASVADRPEDAVAWQRAATQMRSKLDALYHPDGYFRKSLLLEDNVTHYDDTIDIANMYGPFMYAKLPLNDERLQSTVQKIEQDIFKKGPIGGVIRYPGDDYFLSKTKYGGNPWIVCTLWLAQYYISVNRGKEARDLIDWTLARSHPSGVLGEQFDPEDGTPLGVAPLVWSHAELVNTILDFYER